jgi:homoserine dehydrogenase
MGETEMREPEMREIGVGLLGLGNVGAGVVRLLSDNAEAIEARLGAKLVIKAVAVRDMKKERRVQIDPSLLTTDVQSVVEREDVEIVCELIGGESLAREMVLKTIEGGKHTVTANKALLAVHGDQLYAAAAKAGVDLYYEAAVCGGIPIIRALREGLASDRIESITGVVNGTSNFITTAMAKGGRSFEEVLAEAQQEGYAEADPTLDIGGGDAAHKLAILAMLSFGCRIDLEQIHVEGIESLTALDYEMAKNFDYVIKHLAMGHSYPDGIDLRVHPALVPASWLLADVPDTKNALYVQSYALGPSMYYGAGAGMMPTAMSVVSDLIEVARNLCAGGAGSAPLRSHHEMKAARVRPMALLETCYYLRFTVDDQPGVLGQLTTILGKHGVSIAELLQSAKRGEDEGVAVIALTHQAVEGEMQAAIAEIEASGLTQAPTMLLRIAG